jgi:hypothetical protein
MSTSRAKMAARLTLFLLPMLAGVFLHFGQAQELAPKSQYDPALLINWGIQIQ